MTGTHRKPGRSILATITTTAKWLAAAGLGGASIAAAAALSSSMAPPANPGMLAPVELAAMVQPAVTVRARTVDVPLHGVGHETITARFSQCVYDVQAYAQRQPYAADGEGYDAASNTRRGSLQAGRPVQLTMWFTRADAGRWGRVIVTGFPCGTPSPAVTGDWPDLVTVATSAVFKVVAR